MINNVVLTGRLTKDPELKYTANGVAVASFTVAVNRAFTNQSGEREADFINCVAWKKTAETIASYTKKGMLIGVEGRIQTRHYDNNDGQRVYVTEIVVEKFTFLESKNNANTGGQQQRQTNTQSNYQNNAQGGYGGNNYNQNSDPFAGGSQPIDISDDDLPFDFAPLR